MGDVIWKKWRFVGGARVERSIQRVSTFDPFSPTLRVQEASLDDTDVLPSVGVTYNLTPSMAVRAGYSVTVTRPQFRELSPYEFTDVFAGYTTFGNPDLERTRLRNVDVRYEWYPTPGELFAVSYFRKDLENPIEPVIGRGQFVRTFTNADGATNRGFEVEARKSFGFAKALEGLSVNANYTFVDSSVEIAAESLGDLTSSVRPLVGQSRHVFNAILVHELQGFDLESRAYFNYTGARIVEVGATGLPDIVEKGRPTLGLVFSKRLGGEARRWSVELELENLLDRQTDYRIGDRIFRSYRTGREVTIGVSYRFF
jgi:TonB-dependent receptor